MSTPNKTPIVYVSSMTNAELIVVNEASKIFAKTFDVVSLINRVNKEISDSTVYHAVNKLIHEGIFSEIINTSVKTIGFTPYGRSICADVKAARQKTDMFA
jgi:hypothetical protein